MLACLFGRLTSLLGKRLGLGGQHLDSGVDLGFNGLQHGPDASAGLLEEVGDAIYGLEATRFKRGAALG